MNIIDKIATRVIVKTPSGASPIEPVVSSELTGLQKFARELLIASFDGCSFDGDDIQTLALKHGLVRIEPYNPDIHYYFDAVSEGDDYYCFNEVIGGNSC